MAITRPTNLTKPFAESAGVGYVRTIPEASQISITPGAASLTDGFPPLNFLDPTAGGVPPSGQDFNGIIKWLSEHIAFTGAGGKYRFDSAVSTAIGGYPVGTVLQNDLGTQEYISLIANNTHDFNSDPTAIGPYWARHAGLKQWALFNEQQAFGVNAGDSITVSATTRDLNTVVYNGIPGASLATKQITLPAGTYYIDAVSSCHSVERTQVAVYDATAAAYIAYGTVADSHDVVGGGLLSGNPTVKTGPFTLTATSLIELRTKANEIATNGLGKAAGLYVGGIELYSQVYVEKLS